MESLKGSVYLRDNAWYKAENVIKMGIAQNAKLRCQSYITGEVIRGEHICVIEIPLSIMKQIDRDLKTYFKPYNVYKGGGTEFYDRQIINLIVPYIEKYNTNCRVLSTDELYALNNRKESIKTQISNIIETNNLLNNQNNKISNTLLNKKSQSKVKTGNNIITQSQKHNKCRTYKFEYKSIANTDWLLLTKYQKTFNNITYICAYQHGEHVNGFIRFINPITISTVQKHICNCLNCDVILCPDKNNDKYYQSQIKLYDNHFEYGNPGNNNVKPDKFIAPLMSQIKYQNTILEKQQNQIAQINFKIQNPNSNSFNLNSFLSLRNNAFNINEFVNKINITNNDLHNKYAIVSIIDREYSSLEPHKRPIYCTDSKRKILYVYNNNQWIQDKSYELINMVIDSLLKRLNELCMANNIASKFCTNKLCISKIAKMSCINKYKYMNIM